MQLYTFLQFSSARWEIEQKSINQCDANEPQLRYILEEQDTFSTDAILASELVQFFEIPTHLLETIYRRSNGFSSSAETFNQDGQL
ncbi:hypothetical protein BCR34DRAFT_554039 [Clohesyomyces aquaticus]|uniref:Uncharacterized protein n=1 Tax=Clohesyomyces aquaticus TaxID=1231657 RepID=A0A1Y2A723_9PLEO|nr:hypothetical protein BCR34DRAFT_554039 [Clohesyomyces aquaticus]